MKRLVVIGGGIAGLAAAYYAQKHCQEKNLAVEISIYEKDKRWGGKISTEREAGFVIEGGPDTFLATKPWAVALCKELELSDRLHGTNLKQRNTYVLRKGKLHPLPDGLTMMIPTRFAPMVKTGLLTWPEKARMGVDFILPSKKDVGDESLGAFVSRRLGRAAYEQLIEPLMSGIYAGDGDQLSLQSTFPYLRDMEMDNGGLVKGALAMRKKMAARGVKTSGARSIFLTPTTGLAEIVEELVKRLEQAGVMLCSGKTLQSIRRKREAGKESYTLEFSTGESLVADAVILAAPAFASGEALRELAPELAQELSAISYVSTATVSMAYRNSDLPRPLDGYGYVIPRREGRMALACTWTSTKFPHRAPDGYALLRVFVGRAGQEDQLPWDEAGLLAVAREEVRLTMGISAQPLLWKAFLWENAMPQYNVGHPARLSRIETQLRAYPGLALAGNGYRGIGIPDCINSGDLAAKKVLDQLFPA